MTCALVEEYVMRLNGRPTIDQMRQLAVEIEARHGHPLDPEAYKQLYHIRLMQRVDLALRNWKRALPPAKWRSPAPIPSSTTCAIAG